MNANCADCPYLLTSNRIAQATETVSSMAGTLAATAVINMRAAAMIPDEHQQVQTRRQLRAEVEAYRTIEMFAGMFQFINQLTDTKVYLNSDACIGVTDGPMPVHPNYPLTRLVATGTRCNNPIFQR